MREQSNGYATRIYNVALTGLTYYILNFIDLAAYAIKLHPYGVDYSHNGYCSNITQALKGRKCKNVALISYETTSIMSPLQG